MKTQKILFFLVLAFFGIFLSSCKKTIEETPPEKQPNKNNKSLNLGRKLKNPYKKTLMDSAYAIVKQNNPDFPALNIRKTHLYVKVMPVDSVQLNAMSCDSLLEFYNYPLDYEFPENVDVDEAFEPTEEQIKLEMYPAQYACVPVGHIFPVNVPFEVLDELYIPELDEQIHRGEEMRTEFEAVTDSLEVKAFELTNNDINEEDNLTAGRNNKNNRKFNPKGRVTREDDAVGINTLPIHGVRVRARRWFNTKSTFSGVNGNFQITYRFRRPVRYSIDWSQRDFDIRRTANPIVAISQAQYRGPKRRGDWNVHFSRHVNQRQLHFAVIFQAAHDYYYNKPIDIRTPPVKRLLRKLAIGAMNRYSSDAGNHGDFSHISWWWTWPDIRIFRPTAKTHDTYAITIHELAHASHWAMNNVPMYCVRTVVFESWADAVMIAFTNQRYKNYGITTNLDYQLGYQFLRSNNERISSKGYTQIGTDLLDDNNQRNGAIPSERHLFANDNVTDFTIRQVEDGVRNARTLTDWRNAMLGMNSGIRGLISMSCFSFI